MAYNTHAEKFIRKADLYKITVLCINDFFLSVCFSEVESGEVRVKFKLKQTKIYFYTLLAVIS